MSETKLCPCCSGITYANCCKPFHDGAEPSTALALMRSRYAAYALGLADYIQKTTHPKSPHFEPDTKKWTDDILNFCRTTKFTKLEIYGFGSDWVHFCAFLEYNNQLHQLIEKSHFKQVNSHFRYVDGEITGS